MAYDQIQHVFALMLENRSSDNFLAAPGIAGTDAVSGLPTTIEGLSGAEKNIYGGTPYPIAHPGDYSMVVDPGHEFPDVLCQLSGSTAVYSAGGNYPPIDNSGFVASYVEACS